MNGNFRRNVLISSAVSVLILLISSTASFISIRSLLNSNNLVNRTQDIIYNLNEGNSLMLESQTSMRGYLVSGKTSFLKDHELNESKVDSFFNVVEELTLDNPAQQKRLLQLKPLRDQYFRFLNRKIIEKKNGAEFLAYDLDAGQELMAKIKGFVKRIESEEQGLLIDRIENSEEYGKYSSLLIIIAFAIALFISVIFLIRILKDYEQRLELQKELQKKEEETALRIETISKVATQIAEGDYEIEVEESKSDTLGSVSTSLNNMGKSLATSFKLLGDKEWLQVGMAELNMVMLGEKLIDPLSDDIIKFLAVYTNSSAGVLYLLEGNVLHATSGYSHIATPERQKFKVGEGLIGQAAVSNKLLELKVIDDSAIQISYALGKIKPKHIVAFPVRDNKIEGVIELASINGYTDIELEFLNEVANNIGIGLRSTMNRKRLSDLLEETQAQSEELRIQHSEMEAINAELEAQTEKLQASEEELRVQQEELQQTNEELAERSVLLEEKNSEIQKKSEDLEITTRYKSEFLANMSHELRTPLNSILLLSRLLSENNDDNMNEEQIEFAKVIQSSGDGLLGLIDEILDLSKIEAGKMELEFLEVSTQEIANTMKNLFSEVAKEKSIGFEINVDEAPAVIRTDKMRLEQILKNLISNAIKFTAKGLVTFEIKVDPTNKKTICFVVTDSGIGIPLAKQPLIFEAFQQADGSTKRKYGGTGLGLSISRELTKLLKGEIKLKSTVNQGSEFTLCLPVYGDKGPKKKKKVKLTEKEIVISTADKPFERKYLSTVIPSEIADDRENLIPTDKVILIVEDDINFAKSLLKFTRDQGYKGVVAVRGDYALNYALIYRPIGILLDVELPMKSGWEVMEELKGNVQTRPIPVHIMSSHKLKQESLLKGAVNFLHKPVAFESIPSVFEKIEQIINKEFQKVLIIEDNPQHAQALAYFLETYNINSEIKSEIGDGVNALKDPDVECVILDMGIPDKQAYDILEGLKKTPGLENLPVIVFTGKSLSMKEEVKIKKYADSIIVKTAHSYQRMLDEVSLFLHLVEENKDSSKVAKKLNLLNNILNGKKVLIVDDDVRNIYSLTKSLEVFKMNCISAIDGKEALQMLEEHPDVDIVLLDMMMPNMDGYETAEQIRKKSHFKKLPVIAVTAKAMTGDREKCIKSGASDYITKPVDIDQLLSLLRVWLYDKIN
ncbi:response regulator [Flavobacterium sp. TAB 87]|uniref:hybrid sensor histidine kinase/response regulator n=1 Tax=Flavobacterium sp. TAB 87 TaxID=1729581 RepID=UPI00076C8324|nr:response regulator [Flavobacterium sp. TAB 87]KVV14647.1 Autoinducer 2 sensor kinase/phosphatase LuxQ [Flavobacterium sp. TAB 87]